jgi:membrane-bound serine protease (ClpP class)
MPDSRVVRPGRLPLIRHLVRVAVACLAAVLGIVGAASGAGAGVIEQPRVLVTEIATEITPVVADQIRDGVNRAGQDGYAAFVIELDTPGGLVTSTREIVQYVLASRVPVIVHVSPEGARAASAGAIITLASHVAVMAPGTAIGAATPVALDGDLDEAQARKITEDTAAYTKSLAELRDRDVEFAVAMVVDGTSIAVDDAVARGVVDGKAATLGDALELADGLLVEVAGTDVIVATAGATVDRYDMGLFRQIQQVLANPNLAFILLTLGTLGLIYELASPGVGIAGAVGAVSLVLALFSLAILPVNVVGLLLLGVGVALFVGELFAPGFAGFAAGGAVAFVLAAVFLFDEAEGVAVDPAVAIPTAVVLAILAVIAGRLVVRSQRWPTRSSGAGLYTGRSVTVGEVAEADETRGRAFVDGSWWRLRSTGDPLHKGQQVEILAVDGLTFIVAPVTSDHLSEGKQMS